MYTIEQYRAGLNLTPEARANAQITVNFINDVLQSLPGKLRITSTVRTPAHNAAVGGVANSKHLVSRALAVDFVPANGRFTPDLKNSLQIICDSHKFELIVHNVGSGMHYHCEYEPSNFAVNSTNSQQPPKTAVPPIGGTTKNQSLGFNSMKPEYYVFGALLFFLLLD